MSFVSKAIQHLRARDHLAQDSAAPVEQAMRDSNPYETMGPMLPGAPEQAYQHERPERGLELDGVPLDGGDFPDGVGIGMESRDVGLMDEASVGLDSDGRRYFNDGHHPDGRSQVDQMRGVANDARIIKLYNSDMHVDQPEYDDELVGLDEIDYPQPDDAFRPGER